MDVAETAAEIVELTGLPIANAESVAEKLLEERLEARERGERYCIECGCTQNSACVGGCHWIRADLCSRCE